MEKNVDKFLEVLASSAPTPGGGGAAALCSALAIALGNMVGSLTLGKKKYADVQEDIASLNARAEALRLNFVALIDADAEAFAPLAKAYSIPKDAPERAEVMEAALKRAAEPPLEIMRRSAEALDVIAEYAAKGSALAISDAGCAAALAIAAMKAAALNVRINTKSMTNRATAEKMNAETDGLLAKYTQIAEEIYENVSGRLS